MRCASRIKSGAYTRNVLCGFVYFCNHYVHVVHNIIFVFYTPRHAVVVSDRQLRGASYGVYRACYRLHLHLAICVVQWCIACQYIHTYIHGVHGVHGAQFNALR